MYSKSSPGVTGMFAVSTPEFEGAVAVPLAQIVSVECVSVQVTRTFSVPADGLTIRINRQTAQ